MVKTAEVGDWKRPFRIQCITDERIQGGVTQYKVRWYEDDLVEGEALETWVAENALVQAWDAITAYRAA